VGDAFKIEGVKNEKYEVNMTCSPKTGQTKV
jgi:hypothetical protein